MVKEVSCKSKEYYRSIKSINVSPIKILSFSEFIVHRKGDKIVEKRFLRKPVITIAPEDIYKYWGKLMNAKAFASCYGCNTHYDEEKNIFYSKAIVTINFDYIGRGQENHYFETDEEAKEFFADLKDKCKKSGNDLL